MLAPGQSTSWPQGFLLRVTVTSATGRCQRQTDRRTETGTRGKLPLPHFWLPGTGTRVKKQLGIVLRPPCAQPMPLSGPAPRQGGKAPKAPSSGNICFQEERMARFCFLGLVKAGQPQHSSGPPGRFPNPGHHNTVSGGKVSLQLLIPVSRHFAPSQPTTHLETREGWVWLRSMAGPAEGSDAHMWDPNRLSAERLVLARGTHTGVVRRFSMLTCKPSFRSCWKKSCTCRKLASWPGL